MLARAAVSLYIWHHGIAGAGDIKGMVAIVPEIPTYFPGIFFSLRISIAIPTKMVYHSYCTK